MARLSIQEIKPLWDEFCVEIKAQDFYEELATFVEILREGKWKTDALRVTPWLRENHTGRLRPDRKRRASYPKF
jgi:hypothetical protein